jgi:hypothetical protein
MLLLNFFIAIVAHNDSDFSDYTFRSISYSTVLRSIIIDIRRNFWTDRVMPRNTHGNEISYLSSELATSPAPNLTHFIVRDIFIQNDDATAAPFFK